MSLVFIKKTILVLELKTTLVKKIKNKLKFENLTLVPIDK